MKGGKGKEEIEERMREIEKDGEEEEGGEKEKRSDKRNGGEGKRKEAMEEVLGNIEAKVEIEEVKRLGGKASKRRKVVWMRLKSEDQKREVMERKKKLKRREERILDDCKWKERRMKWKLEEIARKKMRKGRRVRIGYGAIRIRIFSGGSGMYQRKCCLIGEEKFGKRIWGKAKEEKKR